MLFKFPKYSSVKEIFSDLDQNYRFESRPESVYNTKFVDVCYSLLEIFANPSGFTVNMLNPYSFQGHFSLGTTWLLQFSFFYLFRESSEYEELSRSFIENTFKEVEFISYSLAEELVNSGKWELAVHVLSFCPNSEEMIKNILFRNIFLSQNSKIDENIPSAWIEEAQALYEKNIFQFESSFDRYLECAEYCKAFQLFMSEIGPDHIIRYTGTELYEKLYLKVLKTLEINSHQIVGWVLSGEVYIEYVNLAQMFERFKKPNSFDEVFSLLQRIECLFLPIQGLPKAVVKQKAAVGIMESSLIA